jgi:hypothetical protein
MLIYCSPERERENEVIKKSDFVVLVEEHEQALMKH